MAPTKGLKGALTYVARAAYELKLYTPGTSQA